jgi:hypothetical protein
MGKFSITATQISFSVYGMKSKIATSSSNVSVKLMDDSVQLEGVIVGALGIKRNKNTLTSYASSS